MKKILLLFIVSIVLCSCRQAANSERLVIKNNHCDSKVKSISIENLPLFKIYDDLSLFLDLRIDINERKIKGNVLKIIETCYEKITKFDEDQLVKKYNNIIFFNSENQVLNVTNESFEEGVKMIAEKNTYDYRNKILSHGKFYPDSKFLHNYRHSDDGNLIEEKTRVQVNSKNIHDVEMLGESWDYVTNYYYDNQNRLVKEVENHLNMYDSVVVKYSYNNENVKFPSVIFKYDKIGNRAVQTNLSYDTINNLLTINTLYIWMSSSLDNKKNEIIISFDDQCNKKTVTSVQGASKNRKQYIKVKYNTKGDLMSYLEFTYPTQNSRDFTYLNEYDPQLTSDYKIREFSYIYDDKGNWIERTEGNQIIKREIFYR